MTIVYCIFSLAKPHGMQRVLTVKANYLAEKAGHFVHIVTRGEGQPHFPLSPAIQVHSTGLDYKKALTELLHAIRPDITISMYGEEAKFLYKINDGSKKILEFHFTRNHLVHLVKGLPHVSFRMLRLQYVRLLQYMDEQCAHHYDCLVLLTEADRALWKYPANAVVIPNPLSFSCPATSDQQSKRILSVGRLIAAKGFDLLIEAFKPIAERYPEWKLTIIGDGQDKEFLQQKIIDLDLDAQAEILPPTPYIACEMLESAIYASASRYEGFGLVITEAMECGLPVVAFDCECGPREIIRDGHDGILVEPLNTEKFSEALLQLIESRYERTQMGRQAKLSAKRFDEHKVMARWETLFNSLTLLNSPVHVR